MFMYEALAASRKKPISYSRWSYWGGKIWLNVFGASAQYTRP